RGWTASGKAFGAACRRKSLWSGWTGWEKGLGLHSKNPGPRSGCLSADQLNIFGRFPPLEPGPACDTRGEISTLDMVGRGTASPDGSVSKVARHQASQLIGAKDPGQ